MASIIMLKKGHVEFEKALEKMDWNTEKFEMELEMFAKTQSPETQEKLRKEYNRFMSQCGWPMELVVDSEPLPRLSGPKPLPELPIIKPQAEPAITPKAEPEVKTEIASSQQQTEPAPNPNEWTHEQKEDAKLVGVHIEQGDSSHAEPIETESPSTQEIAPQENVPNETETKTPERKELHGYIEMTDSVQVKNLLKLINVLVDEATFKLTPQGLTLRAMDPSRVAMIDLVVPREHCVEHLCSEDMKFCVGIERYLDKTLKNITKNDSIRLDIQTGKIDKMFTRLSSKLKRQFSTSLLEVSDEEVPTPKISFNYTARLVLENVNTVFKDLNDHFQINGTQDGLTFQEKGDLEDFTVTLQKGDDSVLNIEAKEESKATYSVSYLGKVLKALSPLTDIIEVSYSTDMPIRISAELQHLGTVNIYMAPRIDCE